MKQFDVRLAQQVLADMILEYDTLFTKDTTEEYNRLEEEHTELSRLRGVLEERVKNGEAVKRAFANWAGDRRSKSSIFQSWKSLTQRNCRQRNVFQRLMYRARLCELSGKVREQNAKILALEDLVKVQNTHLKRVDEMLHTLRMPVETTGLFNIAEDDKKNLDTIERAVARSCDIQSIVQLREFDRTLQKNYYRKITMRKSKKINRF